MLAKKQTLMRRRVTGGRLRRGRTGGGGLLLRPLTVGERLGRKEKLGIGEKKAQNGIITKDISTMTSAISKKKKMF